MFFYGLMVKVGADGLIPDLGHALFANHAARRRPPLLFLDRRLHERSSEVINRATGRTTRTSECVGSEHDLIRSMEHALLASVLERQLETRDPRRAIHIPEHAAISGSEQPRRRDLPSHLPAQDPHDRPLQRSDVESNTLDQEVDIFGAAHGWHCGGSDPGRRART